jgi:hypothetical protein
VPATPVATRTIAITRIGTQQIIIIQPWPPWPLLVSGFEVCWVLSSFMLAPSAMAGSGQLSRAG